MRLESVACKRIAMLTFSAGVALLVPGTASALTWPLGNVVLTYTPCCDPAGDSFTSATNLSKEDAYDFHLVFVDALGNPVGQSYNFTLSDFPSGSPIHRKGTFTFPTPIININTGWTPSAWWTGPPPNHPVIESKLPEPSSWAQMVFGFGLIGFVARRRSSGSRTQLSQR